jgi:hypothetical protein
MTPGRVAGGFGVDLHLANAVRRRPGGRAGTGEDGVADRHGEHDTERPGTAAE